MAPAIPRLTLYRKDGACSLAPHALLTHISIPFSAIAMQSGPVGLEAADGSLSHADFRRINPTGYVPTLTVDSEVVTEMPAILAYIASLAPERNLLGKEGTMGRVKVTELLAWLSGTLHNGFAALWRPNRFTDDVNVHESIRKRGREVIDKGFAKIEQRLRGREWAVGEDVTVVTSIFEELAGVKEAVITEGLDFCFD
ncbi:hypothetical protein BJX66DRAFT_345502 [Aspergillus keveii]|uniref:GST N-terminal domain-containing protein n=1 Tax=Aspergillus keveii TaxID=714993 RepID=A0ABR4FHU1_9EURO